MYLEWSAVHRQAIHEAVCENKQHPNAATTAIELERTYMHSQRRSGSLILLLAARGGGSGIADGIAQLCVRAPARVITQAGAQFVCYGELCSLGSLAERKYHPNCLHRPACAQSAGWCGTVTNLQSVRSAARI